jgi:simple sugar transport system substrate-binding protein
MKKTIILTLTIALMFALIFFGTGCEKKEAAPEEAAEEMAVVEKKHFEGYRIWFDAGGTEGDPVSTVLMNGAMAAANDLGVELTVYFSEWNPEKMIANFKNALATSPDGIISNGIPGEDAFGPVIEEAFSKGTIFSLYAVDLPNIRNKFADQGMGYAGSDLYGSGYLLGKKAIDLWDLGKGDRAMIWGLLAQAQRGVRGQGTIDALEEAGVTIDYIEISDAINADYALGIPTFVSYYSSNSDVDLIVTDHGGLTSTIKTFMEAAKLSPGQVQGAGFDLSAATADAIKSGYLGVVFDQQLWYQAYLTVQQVCFSKAYGFAGVYTDTGSGFVDASNIDLVHPLVMEGIR